MIISINQKYRLESDENNWIVQKKMNSTKGNLERWNNLSFHSTLDNAVTSLFRQGVKSINSDIPAVIKKNIETLRQEIAQAIHRIDDPGIIL